MWYTVTRRLGGACIVLAGICGCDAPTEVREDVAILTAAIEYLEQRFPDDVALGLAYELDSYELPEDAAQALATRFGARAVRVHGAASLVTCRDPLQPGGCSLIGDTPAMIEAKITERTGNSIIAEVKLYQEWEKEVSYHFVRLELSRSVNSWEITEVLEEIIT